MRRLAMAIGMAAAVAAAQPALAKAEVQTLTFTTESITVPAYGVATRPLEAPSPKQDGYVVGMSAEVVDTQGRVQGRDNVMLHHVVFAKFGTPDLTCGGGAERFYAEGEERLAFRLPAGHGYPNKATDRWYLLAMLMNHKAKPLQGLIRYTVRYATGERLTPVRPLWLDVRNCSGLDPSYTVPGTGKRFSTHTETWRYTMPEGGRIVSGGGHLHGGGIRLELHNFSCRTPIFTSRPTWGGPVPRPILHEPGPRQMSQFTSARGIPVTAGQTLELRSVYDNGQPHTRAMGIMLLYLAPGQVDACGKAGPLDVVLGKPAYPPVFTFPLPRQPTGPFARATSTRVSDFAFERPRVELRAGQKFTWSFEGTVQHDVTLVSGPVGFSAPWTLSGTFSRRFTKPGVYNLFCSLHPAQMTQQIVVRR